MFINRNITIKMSKQSIFLYMKETRVFCNSINFYSPIQWTQNFFGSNKIISFSGLQCTYEKYRSTGLGKNIGVRQQQEKQMKPG